MRKPPPTLATADYRPASESDISSIPGPPEGITGRSVEREMVPHQKTVADRNDEAVIAWCGERPVESVAVVRRATVPLVRCHPGRPLSGRSARGDTAAAREIGIRLLDCS